MVRCGFDQGWPQPLRASMHWGRGDRVLSPRRPWREQTENAPQEEPVRAKGDVLEGRNRVIKGKARREGWINCIKCFRDYGKWKQRSDEGIVWVADLWRYGSIKVGESWPWPCGDVLRVGSGSAVGLLRTEHWFPSMARTGGIEIGWLLGLWDLVKPFSLWFSVLTILEGSGKSWWKGSSRKCCSVMFLSHIQPLVLSVFPVVSSLISQLFLLNKLKV